MAYNIMFLGDSITHGVVNSANTESGGYRTELWNLFQADRFNVDLVGLKSNGPLNIDRNHEGQRGWRIDEIINGNTRIAGQDKVGDIDDWLNTSNPNVQLPNAVFMMIGTNDILQDYQLSTAPDRLSQLIDKITNQVPDVRVFISSLLPIKNSTDNQQVQAFNAQIPALINSKVSDGKKVSFVDINSKVTTSDLADGVHPTIDGYTKVANAWYDAFLPFAGIQKTTRIQAEDMTLTNYLVESNNNSALARKLIGLYGSSATTGTASYQFSGSAGNYDLVVGYYDENDGKSTLAVKVGNTEVDRWTLNTYFSSASPDNQTKMRRTVAKGINLTQGTKIEITGTANQTEFARVDYIELIPVSISVPATTSLSANSIATPNDTTYTFSVTYTNNQGIDVSSLDAGDVRVTGPNGFDRQAELINVDDNSNGTPRTATYRINAPGGSWDIADNGNYNVVLQQNQVKDINGNSFSSNNLGTVQVNIPQPQTTIRIEAENMERTGYLVESNSAASNNQLVSLYQSSSTTGIVKTNFTGDSGIYDVILRYFDEGDGQSTLTTRIGGTQIDQSILDRYLGSNAAINRNAVTKTIASALSVNKGTNIEVEGTLSQEEFARIDYIEFKPVTPPLISDLINGTNVADSLTGSSANNTIRGYDGGDSINGGDGNDTLIGGKDNDTLIGGNGQDVFVLAVGDSADTVIDFVDTQDKLGLYGGLKFSQLTISQGTGDNLNDTLIKVTNSSELLATLKGVQVSTITSSDFILV